jgi:hypothetical protein
MPPAGFEPVTSAGEWPQTHALFRAATRTGLSGIQYTLHKIQFGTQFYSAIVR